ncbi:midnolin-like [Argiope bruennichi]|uniref:midnolin-like n=1 Tax=Argiope bruennichi TaxID=94029 RepID=UPI0024959294|nr:midnolin-like [Argiope bruennichi]
MAEERRVFVQPTTGGRIELRVSPDSSVGSLKSAVAKRLKLSKDKIVLLHRNRQLTEGSLMDNNIQEGSKLTLLPTVETGITNRSPERCVMQALETLGDSQVENFLTGRSPLNLTMRLGEHLMFVHLQLTSVPPASPSPPSSPKLLSEASRHLTRTLTRLSSAALQQKMKETCDGRCCMSREKGGAVIESLFRKGKGVFSGTFSGTLMQDDSRPHLCTLVRILSDLMDAPSHTRGPCTHRPAPNTTGPEPPVAVVEDQALRDKVRHIRALLKEKREARRDKPYHKHKDYSSETAVA